MTRERLFGALALLVAFGLLLVVGPLAGAAHAAKMVPLSDSELDAVYAEGLVIDLQFDVAISDGAQIVSNGAWDQVQQLIADGFRIKGTAGDGSTVVSGSLLDPEGSFAAVNPANLTGPLGASDDDSWWSGSGIDIDVVNGNVAIGINIAIFVNSVITDSSIYQFNFNFSNPGDLTGILSP